MIIRAGLLACLLVAAVGAPASGKSTSMRGRSGVAMTALAEVFSALGSGILFATPLSSSVVCCPFSTARHFGK